MKMNKKLYVMFLTMLAGSGSIFTMEDMAFAGFRDNHLQKGPNFDSVMKKVDQAKANADLYQAVLKGDKKAAAGALRKGAKLDEYGENGDTAMHEAVISGRRDIVDLLTSHGLDINTGNGAWQQTPLHYAAIRGDTVMAQHLIDKGANWGTKDEFDKAPLDYALEGDHHGILNVIERTAVDRLKSHLSNQLIQSKTVAEVQNILPRFDQLTSLQADAMRDALPRITNEDVKRYLERQLLAYVSI